LIIRPYVEADEAAVVAIWKESLPGTWEDPRLSIARKLCVQRDLFLVAVDGESVVGTAMAGYEGHRGSVYYLAVHPSRRREGIGRALMKEVERALVAMGCPKINLMVRTSNLEVLAFYERLGFEDQEVVTLGKRLDTEGANP
jgi:ribosomal protein S18 acetylase RimI-like enzyme